METPKLTKRQTQKRIPRPQQRIVSWRLWDKHKKKFWNPKYGMNAWDTLAEAIKAKVAITRGRRDPISNWLRIRLSIVPIMANGKSPRADAIQKLWDKAS